MPKKLRESGFGGLELLLIVAVVLMIGGIGAYVYGQNHQGGLFSKKPAPTSQGTNTGTSTSPGGIPGGANTDTSAATPSDKTVITVKEGSFTISVPNSMKDLTYHLQSNSGGVMTFGFSTTTISKAIPSCAANSGNGAFQTIIRGNGTYPGPANPSSGGLLHQYPTYYLAYNLPNAPCAKGLSVENQNLLDDSAQDFYSSLTSVK